MIGAPWDTMTLLHHAEHLVDLPDKRVIRHEVPFVGGRDTVWRTIEEFDTSQPVVDGLPEDYFADVVRAFVRAGNGNRGRVGVADTLLVDSPAVTAFAVRWLEGTSGAEPAQGR